jgi:hypothetical protein
MAEGEARAGRYARAANNPALGRLGEWRRRGGGWDGDREVDEAAYARRLVENAPALAAKTREALAED